MPRFKITAPDGKSYYVNGPDGATEEDALAHFKSQWKPQAKEQQSVNPGDEAGWGEAGLIGAGKSLSRIGQGIKQGYYSMTGNQEELDKLAAQVAEEDRLYQPLKDAHPISTAIGEAMPSMAIPGSAGLKTMMAAGALPGLLEYGSADERLTRGGMGAAGAGVGVGVMNTLGRLNKPFSKVSAPERNALVDVFKREKIPLSAAQESGSNSLKWVDSALDNLPWVADKQLAAKQAQRGEFNRAISKTFGADDTNLTPDVLKSARDTLGAGFNDLSNRNRLNFTNQTLNDLTGLSFDLERYAVGDNKRIVGNYIDDLMGKVEPDGTISGRAYREFDSKIGKKMRGTTDGDLRNYLGQLRDIVRGAMDDSISAADQESWKTLRNQYANLQTVADTVKNSPTGEVSAAGLLQRVNNQSKSAKFTGGGQLGELARAGKELLTPLPDSGTAQRAFWMRALGGGGLGLSGLGGLMSPVATVGMAAGAGAPIAVQKAMWGSAGKNYLVNGLLDLSPEAEQILRRLGQGAGVSSARGLLAE